MKNSGKSGHGRSHHAGSPENFGALRGHLCDSIAFLFFSDCGHEAIASISRSRSRVTAIGVGAQTTLGRDVLVRKYMNEKEQ